MSTCQNRFNQAAATWDENPRALAIAQAITQCLIQDITLNPHMKVMDFGCGSGLIALPLAAHVQHITAIDNAEQMLAVCARKTTAQGINNISCQTPELNQLPAQHYDLIYSCMTFHHIEALEPLLQQFYRLLRHQGYLAIADLDSEEGNFHDDLTGVKHYGFDREQLTLTLQQQGFTEINIKTAHRLYKQTAQNPQQVYPIFFLVARKQET